MGKIGSSIYYDTLAPWGTHHTLSSSLFCKNTTRFWELNGDITSPAGSTVCMQYLIFWSFSGSVHMCLLLYNVKITFTIALLISAGGHFCLRILHWVKVGWFVSDFLCFMHHHTWQLTFFPHNFTKNDEVTIPLVCVGALWPVASPTTYSSLQSIGRTCRCGSDAPSKEIVNRARIGTWDIVCIVSGLWLYWACLQHYNSTLHIQPGTSHYTLTVLTFTERLGNTFE